MCREITGSSWLWISLQSIHVNILALIEKNLEEASVKENHVFFVYRVTP
jgi:hypothetical protein